MAATRPDLPRFWLFTDEKLGGRRADDPLWRAISNLPDGGGIVFRHYSWPEEERQSLLETIIRQAQGRGLALIGSNIAAPDGQHMARWMKHAPKGRILTAAGHDAAEIERAFQLGADLVFVSPIFPTNSHPDAPTLGAEGFASLAAKAKGPLVPLGGMTDARARELQPLGAHGFAAIDFWARP